MAGAWNGSPARKLPWVWPWERNTEAAVLEHMCVCTDHPRERRFPVNSAQIEPSGALGRACLSKAKCSPFCPWSGVVPAERGVRVTRGRHQPVAALSPGWRGIEQIVNLLS